MNRTMRGVLILLCLSVFATACGRGGGTLCRQGATTPNAISFGAVDGGNGSGSQGDKDCKKLQ